MQMTLKDKLYNSITKDVRFEDEPKQFFVVLRVYNIIMFFYFVFYEILCLSFGKRQKALMGLPWLFLLLISFASTYRYRTRLVFHIFSGINLIWILLYLQAIGWNCGVQHFLFPLLMISFFATYGNFRGKLIYCIFLILFRIWIFFTFRNWDGSYPLSDTLQCVFQVLNMTALFSVMFSACWNLSQSSQHAQEKLSFYNQRLKLEAQTDALTGLWNRRRMLEFLENSTKKESPAQFLSVAIGDIDFFKNINDTRGHNCGDEVLRCLGRLFTSFMAEKGFVCRWGGEEFFFAFPDTNGDDAYAYILQLRDLIAKTDIADKDEIFHVHMSFGVEEYDFSSSVTELIKRADDKLYIGKDTGRNRVIY